MSRSFPHSVLLLVLLISLRGNLGSNSGVGEPQVKCKEAERQALLRIKQDLFVSSSFWSPEEEDINILLSSWGDEVEKRECCEWVGIRCNNISGHVIKLDLSPSSTFQTGEHSLRGNISSSLVDLQHLTYLDLSGIDFGDLALAKFSSIPSFIGSLTKLQHLCLSSTSLGGEIPPQLGNLSSLQFLDLSYNGALTIKSLNWISRLPSLQVLDLSSTNMSLANDWVHVVSRNLPRSLTKLSLHYCDLPYTPVTPASLSLVNSSKVLKVLDLSANPLISKSIFQWLFSYSHSLVQLDLWLCDIRGPIPNGFNNMTALKYLDLSNNMFQGILSERFGNLNSLTYLNLGSNQLTGFHQKTFSNMTALMHLDLSVNQLRGFILESYRNMDSLVYLDLQGNQLDSLNPKSFVNMTAMKYLYLQSNHLKGPIPENFGNSMRSLRELDLSNNMLEGEIPKSIWKICSLQSFEAYNNSLSGLLRFAQTNSFMSCANFSLEHLDLNHNKIIGSLPNFTLYPYLSWLNLSFNLLTGISKSIGQLSKLKDMNISYNSIQGVMSETHFAKLTSLISLDLSSNSNLAVQIHSDWVPPFQLASIHLGSCKLGPHFPKWLQTQKDYSTLDISNSGISDSAPDWLWDFNPNLDFLDLSNNEIKGNVKERVNFTLKRTSAKPDIDLSSNQLQGPIPRFLLQVASLNLFNNSFSQLNSLCNFTESIPLIFLDVSYNQLSGEIPDCWSQASSLRILILANNNLSGKIPVSIGFLTSLNILHLGSNNLIAELPSSLMNCSYLMILDVGENKLFGTIPSWIGASLSRLIIISLRSNHFSGSMPSHMCSLVYLQFLDLSSNDLSGVIPKCLGNITAMREIWSEGDVDYPYSSRPRRQPTPISLGKRLIFLRYSHHRSVPAEFNDEKLVLVWKGYISEFRNIGLLKNIDLSRNKLTGEIPRDITKLAGLISFNLSRNNLSGHIPQDIGQLKSLDALDLSYNHLSGQIPPSLSQVDRLGTLDVSNNNLSGKIPTGTQLQTQFISAFLGNPELCGDPLPKKCPNEEHTSLTGRVTEDGDKDDFFTKGFYISLAMGVVAGFWGFCGTLIFNKSFRYAYLKLLNDIEDWLYVAKEIHGRKLLRFIQS